MRPARAFRIAGATLLALLVVAQFVRRPDLRSPPIAPERILQTHVPVPADVDAILRRACYDCHSHETRWPLYARLAPVSWLVASDVRQGRADLNFSEWGTDPDREPTQAQRLGGICSDLRKGIMPPRSYLWLHRGARVLPAEVELMCQWTTAAREQLAR